MQIVGTKPPEHEIRDAPVRPIVITGAVLAAGTVLVGLIVYAIFTHLESRPVTTAPSNPMAGSNRFQIPPPPRLEEHPSLELEQLRAEEEHTLSTYGWVDKKAGIVRIPVVRAMELQLQRGFPTRAEDGAAAGERTKP